MRDQALEADWNVFRELRERALQRFCERVLSEIEHIRLDATKSSHARYLEIYRLIQRRDEELAGARPTIRDDRDFSSNWPNCETSACFMRMSIFASASNCAHLSIMSSGVEAHTVGLDVNIMKNNT